MLKPDQVVTFKADYNGYFKHLIGLPFTVDRVIPANRKTVNYERVTLLEIDEIHLIGSHHLEKYESA